MSSAKKSALANTAIITVLILISKLFGFVREAIVASTFGAGLETDAFYMSFGITGLLVNIIIYCFSVVFLPMYSEIKINQGRNEADKYASNIINIIFILSVIVTFLGFIFAPQLMRFLAPGFDKEKLILTVKIARIFLSFGAFTVTTGYFTALLNANEKFAPPQLMGLPITVICIIACLLFARRWGIIALVWAYIIAYVSQLFILVFTLKGIYTHRFILSFKNEKLKNTVLIGLPSVVTVMAGNVNTMIDRSLSSSLSEGSVASLRYADNLISFVTSLMITPLATVLFTKFSNQSARDDKAGMSVTFGRGAMFIVAVILPITAITFIDTTDIVKTAYARGNFDATATLLTSAALKFYSFQFLFLGLSALFNRILTSLKDTKSLMVVGCLGIILNITLNFALVKSMGIAGLALATSIAAAFTAGLQLIVVRRKLGTLGLKHILGQFFRVFIATIVCSVMTVLSIKFMPFERPIYRFACCTVFGLISYGITVLLLKVEVAVEGLNIAKAHLIRFISKLKRG